MKNTDEDVLRRVNSVLNNILSKTRRSYLITLHRPSIQWYTRALYSTILGNAIKASYSYGPAPV